jgi:hypothetical protein
VTGMVLTVDRHETPSAPRFNPFRLHAGYAMPFEVVQQKDLDGLVPVLSWSSCWSLRAARRMPSASVSSGTKARSRIPGRQPSEAAHASRWRGSTQSADDWRCPSPISS